MLKTKLPKKATRPTKTGYLNSSQRSNRSTTFLKFVFPLDLKRLNNLARKQIWQNPPNLPHFINLPFCLILFVGIKLNICNALRELLVPNSRANMFKFSALSTVPVQWNYHARTTTGHVGQCCSALAFCIVYACSCS